jgi:MoaA/NifB/PqqE/SkfB family radical SAM enzyme
VIRLLARLPTFRLSRALGRPLTLPATLTVSVLYACNSRCQTCNIYENKSKVLTSDEFARVFRSLGRAPRWVTVSGGEPFLRKDLAVILGSLQAACAPAVVNLPTNGTLPDRVEAVLDEATAGAPRTSFVVNVSLDEIGDRHDEIRGFQGNYRLALETLSRLKGLKRRRKNLTIGIHTVVSRANERRFPELADELCALGPDSYIAEVAEERVELGTRGAAIGPSSEGVRRAFEALRARARRGRTLVELIVSALRLEYYDATQRQLEERREVLPCYAAISSAHVMPNGEVWACCVLGESLGDLRAVDWDFPTLWYSAAASDIRARIKRDRCHCPLANQAYMNILLDPKSLVRAGGRVARGALSAHV